MNPDGTKFCVNCGAELVSLLRNRYRIVKPLGGGGFARTYLAEDVDKLDEHCVVKQLAPQVQGSWSVKKATELFQQEAKRLQHLGEHPQIPHLYAYFKQDDYLYLVQQFIKGQNLLEELKQQGVFDEVKTRSFLYDLLPVIAAVHQQQVIHRDIKPENILRRESDGRLVLIDFGVAKQKTTTATATANYRPGTYIGSFGYAPLEQMQKGEAYPSSDLYSLGCTCFHLLTHAHPIDIWLREGYGWVSKWRQYVQQPISQELAHILDKLLQIHHEERYQSAKAVLQDLNFNILPQQYSSTPPLSSFSTILSPHQPSTIPSYTQPPAPSLHLKKLLPSAVIAGSGSSFLALILLSFLETVWMSSGIWLILLVAIIFFQALSISEKTYLFVVSAITTLFIFLVYQSLSVSNLLHSGLNGLGVFVLLVLLAGLLSFALINLSQLFNKLMSNYF
ncbi:protein kinase [Scytonema sp. UIC 10036]|nr:protein kinase [Scytonema sp. UIC 10036]